MLQVAAILEESIVDGPGIRTVIFLQAVPGIAKAAIILTCCLLQVGWSTLHGSWRMRFCQNNASAPEASL